MSEIDKKAIKERLRQNPVVERLTVLGRELLEGTERPNRISLSEFEPYIDLFRVDTKRYKDDSAYAKRLDGLFISYRTELGINLFQPTIVVVDKNDPKSPELYFLDRIMTRIKGDVLEGSSMRAQVPSAVSVASSTTVDQLMLDATLRDVLAANSTEEQRLYFRRVRHDSALIQRNFVMRNLSPEKREALLNPNGTSADAAAAPVTDSSVEFELDDED